MSTDNLEELRPVGDEELSFDPLASEVVVSRTERATLRRKRRRRWSVVTVAVIAVLLVAGLAGLRLQSRPPMATVSISSASTVRVGVPSPSPAMPWPVAGQGAVAVPSAGFLAQSGPEKPIAVASLTKMVTALVVLRDHPLPAGGAGPPITITAGDVAQYDVDLATDQSTVPIVVGEVLSERQALDALLIASANDVAYALAAWDAGSQSVFAAKMNSEASSLGATSSHYVDASGYDPGSVSTASDSLRIAAAAMAIPTFAHIVGMRSVVLPVAGNVSNVVTEIGTGGVVGVKSGFTPQAGACLVLATEREVGGHKTLVLVAGLGQPTSSPAYRVPTDPSSSSAPVAFPADDGNPVDAFRFARPLVDNLLAAARSAVVWAPIVARHQRLASVVTPWDGRSGPVHVVASHGVALAAWPGQTVRVSTRVGKVRDGAPAGEVVGQASYRLGAQDVTVRLVLSRAVPKPNWWWRLVHG
ncbi:MAG: D-alanyl-D-alanine carboxypeptidase family protein [Acidimicrobiales bacterium]